MTAEKKTPEELLKKFAEKWSVKLYISDIVDYDYCPDECEADLNALLDNLMPTEEEIEDKAKKKYTRKEYQDVFIIACRWIRLIMKGAI